MIDDGSTDGAYERLERLAARSGGRVEVSRVVEDDFRQPDIFSLRINALVAEGVRLVIPFDADEFWNFTPTDLRDLAADREPRVIRGTWVNFVQQRDKTYSRPFSLLAVKHRAETRPGLMREVLSGESSFVHAGEEKLAVWTDTPVSLDRGQHRFTRGPSRIEPRAFEIFHVPLRSCSELTKRGLNYESRRARLRDGNRAVSWQSAFHRSTVLDGRVEEVWRANSVNPQGRLDLYGREIDLPSDPRFRMMILKAGIHLACAYRMLPF